MKFVYNFIFNYLENKIKNSRLIILRYFIFIFLLPFINTYIVDFTIIGVNANDMFYYCFASLSYFFMAKSYWFWYKSVRLQNHITLQNETDPDAKIELGEVDQELNESIVLFAASVILTYIFGNKW